MVPDTVKVTSYSSSNDIYESLGLNNSCIAYIFVKLSFNFSLADISFLWILHYIL